MGPLLSDHGSDRCNGVFALCSSLALIQTIVLTVLYLTKCCLLFLQVLLCQAGYPVSGNC